MDDAPQVKDDQFNAPGRFDQECQMIDTYSKAPLTNNWSHAAIATTGKICPVACAWAKVADMIAVETRWPDGGGFGAF